MKKIYYNKLIRDDILSKMKNLNIEFEVKKLSKKNFERALLEKIREEALEVAKARTKDELIQELADLVIIIHEITKLKNIKPSELRQAQKANMKKKGGFAKKLWLVWSEDNGYKTNEKDTDVRLV